MATLNKAVACLFENAVGCIPPEAEVAAAVKKVYQMLKRMTAAEDKRITAVEDGLAGGDQTHMVWKDLYLFFQKHVEGGASAKSIDRLFKAIDVNGSGAISEEEFTQVVLERYHSIREERALDERLSKDVPEIHVVPGSTHLNKLSKTNAFRVEVVNRAWLRELGAIWAELDGDGDGMVVEADMKRYFARCKPHLAPFIPAMYRAVDKERAGRITFKQFLKALFPEASQWDLKTLMAMAHTKNAPDLSTQADDKLLQEILGVFKVYDDDHSGSLDLEEFISAMELTGHTEAESAVMFAAIDADRSGSISFEEFGSWYSLHYAHFMSDNTRKILDEDEAAGDDYQ